MFTMPGKKSVSTEKSEIHISIQGDVTGNLVIGDKNAANQTNLDLNGSANWTIRIIIACCFLIFLAISLFVFFKFQSQNALATESDTPSKDSLSPGIWKIEIFDNINLNGTPVQVFNQPAETNSESGYQLNLSPQSLQEQARQMPKSNYSMRLVGEFEFKTGYFEFHCEHHDGCRIYVDGHNWIDAWWDGDGGNDMARDLSAGKHVVVIEFYDKSGYGLLEIRWRIKP